MSSITGVRAASPQGSTGSNAGSALLRRSSETMYSTDSYSGPAQQTGAQAPAQPSAAKRLWERIKRIVAWHA